jgi:hypothetical protein
MEYRLRSRDGGYRWHLVRATVVRDSSGAMIKWEAGVPGATFAK